MDLARRGCDVGNLRGGAESERVMLILLLLCCASPPADAVAPEVVVGVSPFGSTAPVVGQAPTSKHPRRLSDLGTLQARTETLGISWPPPNLSLHVDKSDRRLSVRSGDTVLKQYRSGLSSASQGDKVRQGDLRTPVGTFTVVTRNPKSSYHLFLGLSYPDAADADRGLRDGLITDKQARLIREADAADRVPPWNTTLGGAIGIHGNGSSADWTLGCIAVDDDEIEELWDVVKHGTVVVVEE